MDTQRRKAWEIAADVAECFDHETGEVLSDKIDELCAELSEKAEAIHHVLTAHAADIEACKNERARLDDRAKRLQRDADRLERYLVVCMQSAGTPKLKTPTLTTSIKQGSYRVEVVDAQALPDVWWRESIKREPDKAAIAEALKAKQDVPGAKLVRGEDSLSFK